MTRSTSRFGTERREISLISHFTVSLSRNIDTTALSHSQISISSRRALLNDRRTKTQNKHEPAIGAELLPTFAEHSAS